MWQGRAPRLENLAAATSKPTGDNLLSRPSRVLVGLVKSGPRTSLLSGVVAFTFGPLSLLLGSCFRAGTCARPGVPGSKRTGSNRQRFCSPTYERRLCPPFC